jgi:hypothetical protein
MEAKGSSEMLVPSYQTIWDHIPENNNRYSHHHENLKSPPQFYLLIFRINTTSITVMHYKNRK